MHDAHRGAAVHEAWAGRRAGARPALDAFLGAIRAKDLQALGAIWGDKDGAIRDSKRISRDELEKRELLLMCYFSHDSYTVLNDEAGGRRRAQDDRTPDEGNSLPHDRLLARERAGALVRPHRQRGARPRSLHKVAAAPVEASQLGELDEHASGGARVQERDTFPLGAEPRRFVDQPNAGLAAARERTVEIVDREADVMDARAAFGDELADG